jgi:hypothetical protein
VRVYAPLGQPFFQPSSRAFRSCVCLVVALPSLDGSNHLKSELPFLDEIEDSLAANRARALDASALAPSHGSDSDAGAGSGGGGGGGGGEASAFGSISEAAAVPEASSQGAGDGGSGGSGGGDLTDSKLAE